jgi:hypothetical protein
MILDALATFSDQQSLVATAGAILCDKSLDTWDGNTAMPTDAHGNQPLSDIGRGAPLEILVQVTETFDSAGDAVTCVFAVVMADNEALSSNLVVLSQTPAIAQASLVAGYQARLGVSLPVGISKRFLGVRYTTAVADATAGKVTAALVASRQSSSI